METKKLQDLSFEARCGLIAKVIHSANRAYNDAIGGKIQNLSWEEIREEERQGLIKAVISMIKEPKTPETSHQAWCEARKAAGWTKDKVYSQHRKTHPNLIPYAELSFEEQFKDHLFMGIASIFVGGLGMFYMPEVMGEPVAIDSESTKLRVVEEDEDLKKENAEPDNLINGVDKIYEPVTTDQNPAGYTVADAAETRFGGNPPSALDPNVSNSIEEIKPKAKSKAKKPAPKVNK